MNLLALDLSLAATGWAAKYADRPVASGVMHPAFEGAARLESAVNGLEVLLRAYDPDLVVLEGYSFASPNRAHQVGELGGVVRLRLHQLNRATVILAPKVRAKLATGRGNAGKDEVLAEAIRRLGYAGHSTDEADALWLLQAAMIAHLIPGHVRVPKANGEALDGVTWPRLLARAS